jgi:hypothetical protein
VPVEYVRQRGIAELGIAGEVEVAMIVARLEGNDGHRSVPLLIDVTESAVLPKSVQLRRIGEAIVRHQGQDNLPVAVCVAQTVRYGLARQLGVFLETAGIELRPFTDREAAVACLTGNE